MPGPQMRPIHQSILAIGPVRKSPCSFGSSHIKSSVFARLVRLISILIVHRIGSVATLPFAIALCAIMHNLAFAAVVARSKS